MLNHLQTYAHLSHGREESGGVEEPGYPERGGFPLEAPLAELLVTLQQFGEPESQRAGLPRHLQENAVKKNCSRKVINKGIGTVKK